MLIGLTIRSIDSERIAESFALCSHRQMDDLTPIPDDELAIELAIMLKLAPRYMIRDMQSKLPHERDTASALLAQHLAGKMRESRMRIMRLPPAPMHSGGPGWSGS